MNILITGAASGIAKKVIEKIPKEHHIYVTVHTEKQLDLIKNRYQNQKHIECFKLDITNKFDRKKVENLDIDVFISNAAIGHGGSIAEIPINLLRDNYEVNIFSNIEIIQIILSKMIQKKQGRIIIISSLAGNMPIPFLGSYSSSKASLNNLASTLRLEMKLLKSNIKIITVQPGLYYTGFNQVMAEEKFDRMNIDTYFKEQLELLKKYETPFYHLLETNNLESIANKILKAILSKNPKSIYRSRPTQIVFTKLYQLFFE